MCVRAYNNALAEFRRQASALSRLRPSFMSPIETIVAEVERSVDAGHCGINMLGDPSVSVKGQKKSRGSVLAPAVGSLPGDGRCRSSTRVGRPGGKLSLPQWKGYTNRQAHCVSTLRNFCTATQIVPYLIFSGTLEKFPRLNWVFAETGAGWVSSVLEVCDYEWERRHLWTEGILNRPSELFRRQIYVDFWFETVGIQMLTISVSTTFSGNLIFRISRLHIRTRGPPWSILWRAFH